MKDLRQFDYSVNGLDSGFFEFSMAEDFLPGLDFCTIEFDDAWDFVIEFNDGRHQFHQVECTELPEADFKKAQRMIRDRMKDFRRERWQEECDYWGSL